MQPRGRKARPVLDMNPDSLRVNVQTATEAVFSPEGEQPWQHSALKRTAVGDVQPKGRTFSPRC